MISLDPPAMATRDGETTTSTIGQSSNPADYLDIGSISDMALRPIAEKIAGGKRLDFADGMALWNSRDIFAVGHIANAVREAMHGRVAYYNINRHINYSNICALSCKFCEFQRKRGEEGAYEYDLEKVYQIAAEADKIGATEIHIFKAGVAGQMAQFAAIGNKRQRDNRLKAGSRILQFPQLDQMVDPFGPRFHMAVKDGGVGGDAQLMRDLMDIHPAVTAELSLENFVMHAVVKHFRAAAGHGTESMFAQGDEHFPNGKFGYFCEMVNFNRGKAL